MQDHEVIARPGGVPRRASAAAVASSEATRTTLCVATMSLLAVSGGIGAARAHVVVQQLHPRRGQVRREPGDADVHVVDVIEIGLFGPAVLCATRGADPKTDPKNLALRAESLTAMAV